MSRATMSGLPTLSPDRKFRSRTRPVSMFFILVRTNATPLPGFTCWAVKMMNGSPSTSIFRFLRKSVVSSIGHSGRRTRVRATHFRRRGLLAPSTLFKRSIQGFCELFGSKAIATGTAAADHAEGDIGQVRMMPKGFPGEHVAEVDLHKRHCRSKQRVAQRDTRMRVRPSVHDCTCDTVRSGEMYGVEQRTLVVRLYRTKRESVALQRGAHDLFNLSKRGRPVHRRLARAEQVQVWAVEKQDLHSTISGLSVSGTRCEHSEARTERGFWQRRAKAAVLTPAPSPLVSRVPGNGPKAELLTASAAPVGGSARSEHNAPSDNSMREDEVLEPRRTDWAIAALLLLLAPALFLIGARSMGLWEPWETALATLGWRTATTEGASIFLPVADGLPIARPWLQTLLLKVGYLLGGGSEAGLRAPFALLNAASVAGVFVLLRLSFSRARALMVSLIFVATPAFALSSMTLAGGGHLLGPSALTLVLLATAIAHPERRNLLVPAAGAAMGLCFWAAGIVGLALPIFAVALLAATVRDPSSSPTARAALGLGLGGGLGLVATSFFGIWGAGGSLAPDAEGFVAVFVAGWAAWGPLAALTVVLGLPMALLLGALPGSRLAHVFWSRAGIIGLGVALLVIAPGLLGLRAAMSAFETMTATDAIGLLFGATPMTGRVLPAHTTFDVVIRLMGFAAYPMVTLAPFGFGWLLQSADSSCNDTLDTSIGLRDLKRFIGIWMALAFAAFGLQASSHHYLAYSAVLPICLAIGLGIGDTVFLRSLYRNRTAWYVIGLASVLLLALLSKDVRGTYNLEMGRPGPQVIFELLLLDGQVDFPAEYAFGDIKIFFVVWVLLIVMFFVRPVEALGNLSAWFANAPESVQAALPRFAARPVLAFARVAARVTLKLHQILARLFEQIYRGSNVLLPATIALVASMGIWGAQLAVIDVPAMTYHFSQRGMLETFERFAEPGTQLHAVGITRSDATYYLREGEVERRNAVSDLRALFCEEGRAFAIISADDLGQAYYHVRRDTGAADEADEAEGSGEAAALCPPQQLYVIDARSSRYLLVSDQLNEAAGETQQSYIAQHVFTEETLPADIDRPETRYLVDGKLELVGYQVTPAEIDRGQVTIDSYWRVLETPRAGYKAFIHVDFRGNRINGDHELVGGRFPMQYWLPGEIVRDSYQIEVGRADRAGTYRVLFGFFRGDDRLSVEPDIGDNRIPLGDLEVRR
jgi:4-amino-4-deoxy-L-arabinose transferase-like glycosyltransferase